MPGILNRYQGRLRRPADGMGKTDFSVDIGVQDFEGEILRTVGRAALAMAPGAAQSAANRSIAATHSARFYGTPLVGTGAAAGGILAAGALKDLTKDLVEASDAFEAFQRTVQATEATSEAAAKRLQKRLEMANETVAIDRTSPNQPRVPSPQEGTEGVDAQRSRQKPDNQPQTLKNQEAADKDDAEEYEKLWKQTFQNVTDAALNAISQRNVSFGNALSQVAQKSLKEFSEMAQKSLKGFTNSYIREHIFGEEGGAASRLEGVTAVAASSAQKVTDTAIDAIFQRNISFGDALSQMAQKSLKEFANFYIREHIFGKGGGATIHVGSATAAGAGVALGGARLLFPQEFNNLFEEIGKSFSLKAVQKLFHDPVSDLYAQAKGAEVVRAFDTDHPDARRNARDFADNFSDGFLRQANVGGNDVINITINVADLINNSDDGIVQLSVRMKDLEEQGQLPASKG